MGTPAVKGQARDRENLTLDYRSDKPLPDWVREVIDTALAIEVEDAKSAGALGFMARALVIATMPYKDPKTDAFVRTAAVRLSRQRHRTMLSLPVSRKDSP